MALWVTSLGDKSKSYRNLSQECHCPFHLVECFSDICAESKLNRKPPCFKPISPKVSELDFLIMVLDVPSELVFAVVGDMLWVSLTDLVAFLMLIMNFKPELFLKTFVSFVLMTVRSRCLRL